MDVSFSHLVILKPFQGTIPKEMQNKKIVLFFLELAVVGEAPCNYNNFSIGGFILFTDFEDK